MTTQTAETLCGDTLALTLHWEGDRIVSLDLLWADGVEESPNLSEHALALKGALLRYEARESARWPDLPFSFDGLSDFQAAAVRALRTIPRGTTLTYGELAARLNRPQGAQAVGRAMGANPFPLVYPCHRVVGSGGEMTGFSASGGVAMKEHLLRLEGALQPLLPGLE